jgi:hypothetical protein
VQVTVEVVSPTGRSAPAGPDPVGEQEEEITPDPWPARTAEQAAFDGLGLDGKPVDIGPPETWRIQGEPPVEAGQGEGVPGLPQRQECTWLGADGQFCGAGDLPPGELFCAHHGTSSPEDEEEEDDVLDRAHDRVGQRVRHLRWDVEGTVTGAWEDGELAVRFDGAEFTENQCSPNDLEVITGPGSGSYRLTDAERRASALRAAGWTGPIDPDGHAVHGEPKWAGLSGVLTAIEQEATDLAPCCRCVLDPDQPQWDQVADCRCVVGQGADRAWCTCGPWDLALAIREDDEAEDRGDIDGDGRATCHRCQDWADHAHRPFTSERISVATYGLESLLRQHPSLRAHMDRLAQQDTPPGSTLPGSTGQPALAPQSPAGPVAGGSAGQHDQQDGPGHPAGPDDEHQEDGMPPSTSTGNDTTEMTITSGAGGTSVTGGARMGGQLTAVGDLRAEVTELRAWAEVGIQMLTDLERWAAGLPDQVAGAQWSTQAVTAAAVGLAEARTVEEVRSGITRLLAAVAEAERLGEQLAAGGARKGVAGLRPQ